MGSGLQGFEPSATAIPGPQTGAGWEVERRFINQAVQVIIFGITLWVPGKLFFLFLAK